jgi:hypothetical protein
MGPSAGFTISEWQPVLQRQAQQQGARGANMLAEGAQQAHEPLAAMRELVDTGWMETGLGADPEVLRRLAGMLSECLDNCVSALSNKVSASGDVAHRTTACVVPTSTRASDASHSFVPHNVNGFCFGTLNVRGKLGSNVQEVVNLLSNVKLDILCIQESLHATIEVPDYL